ncbi:MAG: outer membrane protein transport protein [Candidatus Cloacimonadales bacterium]|nr:outer membrane protein transport protein [Candidatus Cloacimonadales bacterium]
MKKIFCVSVVLLISIGLFANGLSLNSIGPRALGMGGAFVGLADDGSAIYWNPAGLAGQASGINISGVDIIPFGNYKYDAAGVDADQVKNNYASPDVFASYSMGKMAFGLGLYVPAGLGAEYEGEDLQAFTAIPGAYAGDPNIEWMSLIGVVSISPSFAYQVTDKWTLGVAGNVYYGMFDMKRFGANLPDGTGGYTSYQYDESSTGLGYGATIGTMYKFSDKVNLGFTYRSPVTVNMSGTAENGAMPLIAGSMGMVAACESDFDREVTWPTWIAGGIACTPTDKLTLTFDLQWSDWKALDKLVTEYDDLTWATILGVSGDNEFILNWESKTQVRLGMEYKVKPCFSLRSGWYYDPAPAPDETLNILFPSGTYSVVTGGCGYMLGNFSLDFGTEYLFGAERNVAAAEHNMPGKHSIDIFAFALGVGYKF